MDNIDILVRTYEMWHVFDEWTMISGKKFTDYEIAMFKWIAIFGAAQDSNKWIDVAPNEIHIFLDKLMNGEYLL